MVEQVEEAEVYNFGDVTVRARKFHGGLSDVSIINDLAWLLYSRWDLVNEVSVIV